MRDYDYDRDSQLKEYEDYSGGDEIFLCREDYERAGGRAHHSLGAFCAAALLRRYANPVPTRLITFLSRLLPSKVTAETFEPSLNDAKGDYLRQFHQCKSKASQRFLKLCFSLHVALMVGQCFFDWLTDSANRVARILVK
jgi:hypothetical protein